MNYVCQSALSLKMQSFAFSVLRKFAMLHKYVKCICSTLYVVKINFCFTQKQIWCRSEVICRIFVCVPSDTTYLHILSSYKKKKKKSVNLLNTVKMLFEEFILQQCIIRLSYV